MLWENHNGLQDKFVTYWDTVSARFANNPYVVGYDPINEPMPANLLTDPSLALQTTKMDKTILTPLYKRTYDVYQKHDSSKTMFFEPCQVPDVVPLFHGIVNKVGFEAAPGANKNN